LPEEDSSFNLGEVLLEEDSSFNPGEVLSDDDLSFNLAEVLPDEDLSFNPAEVLPVEAAQGRKVGAEGDGASESGSNIELVPKSLKRMEEPDQTVITQLQLKGCECDDRTSGANIIKRIPHQFTAILD
jgi:hypothetical protein